MTAGYYNQAGAYLGLNVTAIDQLHYFNTTGKLVKEIPALTVAHEFIHFVLGADYGDPANDEALMNGANFDFDGNITRKQNDVARELGLTENLQVSYNSFVMSSGDARFSSLFVGVSYTEDNVVDVVRLGDAYGTVTVDTIDHTLRTDKLRDLIFGFGGNDSIKSGKGNDYVYGGAGADTIWGGEGDDVLVGEGDDDTFRGNEGNDIIWGGDIGDTQGFGDGDDTVEYSSNTAGVTILFNGAGEDATITVDEGGSVDTLYSIEKIVLTGARDQFQFSGSIPDGYRLTIDAAGGQSAGDIVSLAGALGSTINATVTADGRIRLTSPEAVDGWIELVGFSTNLTIVGSDQIASKFIGAAKGTTFRAGGGGGDFTLFASDRAYGYAGAIDIFRVSTTVPEEFAGYTEAEKIDYLARNRVYIHGFGDEDQIWVNGVRFTGNIVTSTAAVVVASDPNGDLPISYPILAGNSSYDTFYPQAVFEELGQAADGQIWGAYRYEHGTVRDVSFHRTGADGPGLISFITRGMAPAESWGQTGYTLKPLAAGDEMLTIVIDGFSDGEGGISFGNDALANFDRATGFGGGGFYGSSRFVSWGETDPPFWVGYEYDTDGNPDGYMNAGGSLIESESEDFNYGHNPFERGEPDWEEYVAGGDVTYGTGSPDLLEGGAHGDLLIGSFGDDVLYGRLGNDKLLGGFGFDHLIGDGGDDYLDGGEGDDILDGGDGDDRLVAGQGFDEIDGGAGTDRLILSGSRGSYEFTFDSGTSGPILVVDAAGFEIALLSNVEEVYFEASGELADLRDLLTHYGTEGADTLIGTAFDDRIFGLDGNDVIRIHDGGDDLVDAGEGVDSIYVGGALTASDEVDGGGNRDSILLQGDYSAGLAFGTGTASNISNIEGLSLLSGLNTAYGDTAGNLYTYHLTLLDSNVAAAALMKINGSSLQPGENFTLDASAESDAGLQIFAGLGTDDLTGGQLGDNFIFGHDGRFGAGDIVDGQGGYDVVYLRGDYVIDFNAPGFAGSLVNVESIGLLTSANTEFMGGGDGEFDYSIIWNGAMLAAGATFTVNGSRLQAHETFVFNGGGESDGNLRIWGGASNDTLATGGGNDLVYGGGGADQLSGGSGADVFRYDETGHSTASAHDTILDFQSGTDKIELTRIDANTGVDGNQAFAFIGDSAFTAAGQLRAFNVSGDLWQIEGDVNGDGQADLVIQLHLSGQPLTPGDFMP
jgi:Ca2+-binding RTX toxin-like protein